METQIVNEQYFYDIANAIRRQNGESTLYRPQDMADAILSLPFGVNITPELIQVLNKTITTLDDSIDRKITNIGQYVCYSCEQLTTVNLPACTSIGSYAFNSCSSLTSVNLPNVTSIETYAFSNCNQLQTVNLPACRSIGNSVFSNCRQLQTVNLPVCISIGLNVFSSCTSLTSITLSNSTMCTLGTNAFNNTPIEDGTGYIYVPANLVDTYKSATNWSTYANQIVAIPSE